MLVYDTILGAHKQVNHDYAIDYARGMVWSECETTEQDIRYKDHIKTVEGVGVYYDFGADYYFFTDETRGE